MKTLIFTLAFVAVAWGCSNEDCMKTSTSLPIQFYDLDEPTYNEQQYPGVYKPCFCQPWIESTPLRAQVTEADPDKSYALLAYDMEGTQLGSWLMFLMTDGQSFSTQIVPESEGLTGNVTFGIGESIEITNKNPSFDDDLSDWYQQDAVPTAGASWSWNVAYGSGYTNVASKHLKQDMSFTAGTYRVTWGAYMDTESGTGTATVYFFNASGSIIDQINITGSGHYSGSEEFQGVVGGQPIASFSIRVSGGTWNGNFYIKQLLIDRLSNPDYTKIKKSDCVDIRESFADQDLTLIRYWDVRNWDDLVYPQTSPFEAFNLWVPATFWKTRNVSEQTEHRTSGKRVVKMNSTMIKQRLFETDHLPIEFHEKILHVLSHNQVWIDGRQYTNGEGYVVEEDASNRFAFQKATAWLTDAESVLNNVI